MKLENYGYKEEKIKVRTMTMAELRIGIVQELLKKNYRYANIRLVCLTDGTVDAYKSTEDFLMAEFNYAWEIELLSVMERMGYTNSCETLDAREFGLPQARERVFTISILGGEKFNFNDLIRTQMRNIGEFLEDNDSVSEVYDVTQPSVYNVIGHTGIKRATVIKDYAFTITTRQDRTPAQVIECGGGRYRYLTELECWRLQGYTDEDFQRAKDVQERKGRYYTALYKQAGNSIAVPIFESIFRKIILGEVKEADTC